MKYLSLAAIAILGLGACGSPNVGPGGTDLPPLGLASSAVWLEQRQGSAPRPIQPKDIPTATLAAQARGETVDLSRPIATPVAQAVPQRARPSSTVGLAAQSFADACVGALPSMASVVERMQQVNQRDYGLAPRRLGDGLYIGGEPRGNILLEVADGVGRNNVNHCQISVRRQDPQAAATAFVGAVTGAGYALRPVTASNAQQAWQIVGAPSGTILKLNQRTNVLGQQLTGAWITWR